MSCWLLRLSLRRLLLFSLFLYDVLAIIYWKQISWRWVRRLSRELSKAKSVQHLLNCLRLWDRISIFQIDLSTHSALFGYDDASFSASSFNPNLVPCLAHFSLCFVRDLIEIFGNSILRQGTSLVCGLVLHTSSASNMKSSIERYFHPREQHRTVWKFPSCHSRIVVLRTRTKTISDTFLSPKRTTPGAASILLSIRLHHRARVSVYDDDVKHAESARGQKAESINFISFSVSSRLLMWLFDAFKKKKYPRWWWGNERIFNGCWRRSKNVISHEWRHP